MANISGEFEKLAVRVEASAGDDRTLATEVASILRPYLLARGIEAGDVVGPNLLSTDFVLKTVARVAPGWSIILHGKASEPDGHWRASIRPSTWRDEAEVIGLASGRDLSNTVLASLLRLLAYRAQSGS